MEETLNIDYHRRLLIVKALNRTGTCNKAASILGIHERTVKRLKRRYGIVKCPVTKTYEFKNQ